MKNASEQMRNRKLSPFGVTEQEEVGVQSARPDAEGDTSEEGKATMLQIRRVQTGDIDTDMNARLDHLLLDEGMHWDAEQGRRFLADEGNALFLAELDGVAVGFATVHRLQRFDARRAEILIYDIGVEEGARRQGIGRALIAHITGWAKEVGADNVWVLADGDDDQAQAFYAGTGGERFGPGAAMFTYYTDETPD